MNHKLWRRNEAYNHVIYLVSDLVCKFALCFYSAPLTHCVAFLIIKKSKKEIIYRNHGLKFRDISKFLFITGMIRFWYRIMLCRYNFDIF